LELSEVIDNVIGVKFSLTTLMIKVSKVSIMIADGDMATANQECE
jgi:hypothetical protein